MFVTGASYVKPNRTTIRVRDCYCYIDILFIVLAGSQSQSDYSWGTSEGFAPNLLFPQERIRYYSKEEVMLETFEKHKEDLLVMTLIVLI